MGTHSRRDRGKQPEDDEVARRDAIGEARDRGSEGRLVDVAPGEVPAGLEEVELVTVPSISARHEQQQRGDCASDAQHRRPRHRLAIPLDPPCLVR